MENLKMKVEIDDLTNDTVLSFYINKNEIGSVVLEYIENKHRFIGQMSDTILDLDESIFMGEDLQGGFYIQDVWINKLFRGNGYFKPMFSAVMNYIDKHKDEYACVVLRAFSDNPNVPNEKLSELYQRYGFEEVQHTEEDGIVMIR